MNCRLASVGCISTSSPRSAAASASPGATQRLSSSSASSWRPSWPSGAAARKKRVSKRRRRLTDRRHPVRDVAQGAGVEQHVVTSAQLEHRQARRGAPPTARRRPPGSWPSTGGVGEQQARLLEALADRRDPVGQATARHAEARPTPRRRRGRRRTRRSPARRRRRRRGRRGTRTGPPANAAAAVRRTMNTSTPPPSASRSSITVAAGRSGTSPSHGLRWSLRAPGRAAAAGRRTRAPRRRPRRARWRSAPSDPPTWCSPGSGSRCTESVIEVVSSPTSTTAK